MKGPSFCLTGKLGRERALLLLCFSACAMKKEVCPAPPSLPPLPPTSPTLPASSFLQPPLSLPPWWGLPCFFLPHPASLSPPTQPLLSPLPWWIFFTTCFPPTSLPLPAPASHSLQSYSSYQCCHKRGNPQLAHGRKPPGLAAFPCSTLEQLINDHVVPTFQLFQGKARGRPEADLPFLLLGSAPKLQLCHPFSLREAL